MIIWLLIFIIGSTLLINLYVFVSEKIEAPRRKLESDLNNCRHEKEELIRKIEEVQKVSGNYKDELILKNQNLTAKTQLNDLEVLNKTIKIQNLEKDLEAIKKKYDQLLEGYEIKDKLFKSFQANPLESISKISSLYSDFLLVQYDISARYLESKKNPATMEALRIKDLKIETKAFIEQYRQMLYKYESLLQLFPELSNYVDDYELLKKLEEIDSIKNFQENFDRVRNYISKEEYQKLNIDQRNQLALDRYLKSQKSKWQIGRDYELFCGLEYEKKGWNVNFFGIEKKIEDMGRDLIAYKGNEHHVIQCKYWAKEKVIHEKHITQLFGTTIEYSLNLESYIKVVPVFITNISLSDKANQFANKLGVVVKAKYQLENFPRIKCNINKDEYGNETKIYHLPFDQ